MSQKKKPGAPQKTGGGEATSKCPKCAVLTATSLLQRLGKTDDTLLCPKCHTDMTLYSSHLFTSGDGSAGGPGRNTRSSTTRPKRGGKKTPLFTYSCCPEPHMIKKQSVCCFCAVRIHTVCGEWFELPYPDAKKKTKRSVRCGQAKCIAMAREAECVHAEAAERHRLDKKMSK
jgi:hypothetical protein